MKRVVAVAFANAVKVGKSEYTYLNAQEHKMDITLEEGYLYFTSIYDGSHSGCPVNMVKWFTLEDGEKVVSKKSNTIEKND